MKRLMLPLSVLLSAVLACGCGTVHTFWEGEPAVYGGVRKDAEWFEEFVTGASSSSSAGPMSNCIDPRLALAFLALIFALEPPLSFMADTLTLPITYYLAHQTAAPNAP